MTPSEIMPDMKFGHWKVIKYDHTNKKIVLGLADGSEFKANNAQSGGTFKLAGISTVEELANKFQVDNKKIRIYRCVYVK